LWQTHRMLRVIVAVHGCTDGTLAALYARYGRDTRICWLRVPRRRTYPPTAENHWLAGPVDPLNAGLARVDGSWIARIDDDDEWEPDHLDSLLEFARAGDYEFVSSAHVGPSGKVPPYNLGGDGTFVGGCQTWLYRSYLRFFRYNRDCWRKSWNRVNDTDMQDRMRRAGVRMGYLNKVTCRISPRPGETAVGLAAYLENCHDVEARYAFSK